MFKTNKRFLSKYTLCLILLVFLASFLRLYNFGDRWGLSADDSRDVAIAQQAVSRFDFPPIGPFSSAGPFVFGPLYYWVLMVPYLLFPHSLLAAWVFAPFVGGAIVGLFALLGRLMGGRKLSLFFGLIAAVSPQLVMRSMMVSQHMFLPLVDIAVLICLFLGWKRKKVLWMLGMGLCIGLGISVHYQNLNLIIFLITPLFIPQLKLSQRVLFLFASGLGILIPSLPLLYWDSFQGFANTRNIMDFFLIGQYRFYVASSWKLFLTSALPNYWSFVIGGNVPLSFALMGISLGTIFYELLVSRVQRNFKNCVAGLFLILLILNRYYRGERFEGYLVYLAPFILLFSALGLWFVIKRFKVLGFALTFVVVVCSLALSLQNAANANNRLAEFTKIISVVTKAHPHTQFVIYDPNGRLGEISQSLSLLMADQGLSKQGGYPIAICDYCSSYEDLILLKTQTYQVIDLGRPLPMPLQEEKWHDASPENLYDQLVVWARKHSLTSSFSLESYVLEKLHLK